MPAHRSRRGELTFCCVAAIRHWRRESFAETAPKLSRCNSDAPLKSPSKHIAAVKPNRCCHAFNCRIGATQLSARFIEPSFFNEFGRSDADLRLESPAKVPRT